MTYALFTDDAVVINHLKSGDMNVTLSRTKLTSTYLTNKGFLDTITDTEELDFTDGTSQNVFGFKDTVVVPSSKYIAEMKITNNSPKATSNVAFSYWVEIIYTGADGVELAKQISVTVDTAESKRLNEGLVVGSESAPIGVLGVDDSDTFTVTVEFLDLGEENNKAQGNFVTFDLVVHAVQYVGELPAQTA